MARGVNKVILIGNVGQDPEIRFMPNGNAVANLTVATSDVWKDKDGQKQERTEWHRISVFGKIVEAFIQPYVKKGSKLYIEGRLQTRKWQDQDGNDRYTTEIIVDMRGDIQSLDSAGGNGQQSAPQGGQQQSSPQRQAAPPQQSAPSGGGGSNVDDEIPFAPMHCMMGG